MAAPPLLGALIHSGSRHAVAGGYLAAAGLMMGAVAVEVVLGVKAERRSLESIAAPLGSAP